MSKSFIALAISAWFLGRVAEAQDASHLPEGTRVRLTTAALDATQRIGTIVSATHDTIAFRADHDPITRNIAVAHIVTIETSGGVHTHRSRDAAIGALLGGVVGAIVGGSGPKPSGTCFIFCDTRGQHIAEGALEGLTIGWPAGFIVGGFDKTERWMPLNKPTRLSLAPAARGARISYALRF